MAAINGHVILFYLLVTVTHGNPPKVDVNVKGPEPRLNQTLTLLCTANVLQDDVEFSWSVDGRDIPSQGDVDDKYSLSTDNEPPRTTSSSVAGATLPSSELRVSNLAPSDQGSYQCTVQVEGILPSLKGYYVLDFNLPPMLAIDNRQGLVGSYNVGDQTTIHCMILGTVRELRWYFRNESRPNNFVDEQSYLSMFPNQTTTTRSQQNGRQYLNIHLNSLQLKQDGEYGCYRDNDKVSRVRLHVFGVQILCMLNTFQATRLDVGIIRCYVGRRQEPRTPTPAISWIREEFGGSRTPILPGLKYKIIEERLDGITVAVTLMIFNVNWDDGNSVYWLQVGTKKVKVALDVKDPNVPGTACTPSCLYPKVCDEQFGSCVCPQATRETIHGTCEQNRETRDDDYEESGPSGNGGKKGREGREDDDDEDGVVVVKTVSVPTIVGSTLGALAVVLLVLVGYVCFKRRRKLQAAAAGNADGTYRSPDYLYQYEYHGEAVIQKDNPTVINPGYQALPKPPARKENTYIPTEKDELEFPREQLQLGVDLGEGRFGKVIQARAMNITGTRNWEKVAVKTCKATATDSEKQDLYQELEIMKKLPKHVNIVSLLGCCSKSDPLYIILEYAHRGSLLSYLRKCRPSSVMSRTSVPSVSSSGDSGYTLSTLSGRTLSTTASVTSSFMQPRAKDLTIFALQIAKGMAHLASSGIVHRDLAARNVLLDTDFTCKICDFGLARDVEGVDVYERTSKGPLPIRWLAPEALADNKYTKKSDVWSYGVLLWEIVTLGATPYSGMSAMDVMRCVRQGQFLQRPLHCKEEMYELMVKCWEKENSRPTFADIVEHHEALMDDDYIVLSDYDENDYGWLESYTTDERR